MRYAEEDLLERGITEMIAAIQSILESNLQTRSFLLRNRHSDEFKYAPKVPAFLNSLVLLLEYEKYLKVPDLQLEQLRLVAIQFISRYAYENIADILKAEESFENKKNQGYEVSPLQRLIEGGTKSLEAIFQSELIDPLLSLVVRYQTNP